MFSSINWASSNLWGEPHLIRVGTLSNKIWLQSEKIISLPSQLGFWSSSEDAVLIFPEWSVSHSNIEIVTVFWSRFHALVHHWLRNHTIWTPTTNIDQLLCKFWYQLTIDISHKSVDENDIHVYTLKKKDGEFKWQKYQLFIPDTISILWSREHDKHIRLGGSQLSHLSFECIKSFNFVMVHHS